MEITEITTGSVYHPLSSINLYVKLVTVSDTDKILQSLLTAGK
jgi:hypothetical protein